VVVSCSLPGVFLPGQTIFSNDGPLGRLMSECHKMPSRFFGSWEDLNGIGFSGSPAPPGITFGLQFLLKPILFSKYYALVSLVILGLGAWCFFVNLRLAPIACILGGLAAALNSNFFSVACWGVAAQAINVGMFFFALAALADTTSPRRWFRVILAGLASGMGVIEGSDVGAIFSLYLAAYVIFQAWTGEGLLSKRISLGLGRLAVVALCAALMAAPALYSLAGSNIKGVVIPQPDSQNQKSRWDWATQWSLPVRETIGLALPGIFGFRVDTPGGGQYWGEIGRDPAIDRYIENGEQGVRPKGIFRQTGGGFYSGVLVVILALWAIAESFRKKNSVFTLLQRKWLWFWLVVVIISALLAFGRFAPFYKFVFELPYFSSIRNPVKFINLVCLAIIILFAYGMDGLWRRYMQPAEADGSPRWTGFKVWWAKAGKTEKSWIQGWVLALAASLVGWFGYATQHRALLDYLLANQFSDSGAQEIASFSIRQVGWFVLFFALSTGLIACIFSGAFAGARARWGGIVLGLLLVADLTRANQPWVVYWNYHQKYASNPIMDLLKDKPFEHRVSGLGGETQHSPFSLSRLYNQVWLQQQFPYYNIQTINIVQMSRTPADYSAFISAMNSGRGEMSLQSSIRYMKLTNARLVLGEAAALDFLNQDISQADQQFRIMDRFDIVPKPGITNPIMLDDLTTALDPNGTYALFDFAGALPRAKLYSNWQTDTNDQDVLACLTSPAFDPNQTVLVSGGIPSTAPSEATNQNVGSVDFSSYSSKNIVLKSNSSSQSVLLLNDHFDPNWKVLVDGTPAPLLRCNFIMRGVYLSPGSHTVEFRFQQFYKLLFVSLAASAGGIIILIGFLATSFSARPKELVETTVRSSTMIRPTAETKRDK